MSEEIAVTITRQDKYRFLIDFGPAIAASVADEPPPLGDGAGPAPDPAPRRRRRQLPVLEPRVRLRQIQGRSGRIAHDGDPGDRPQRAKIHFWVQAMKVAMTLGVAAKSLTHLDRALAQFEDFCTVSQSVRTGIPFTVTVQGADGRVLK